jgi:halogenation protein CepH
MRVIRGEDAEPELPLFPDGLVTSPDGMKWLPHRPM